MKSMKIFTAFLIFIFLFIARTICSAQEIKPDKALLKIIDENFKDADAQYKVMMNLLPAGTFPKTYQNDTLRTSDASWWCSGFYPGSLLQIYQQTKDTVLYNEALRMLNLLNKEQYNTSTHDLGFMMYCS